MERLERGCVGTIGKQHFIYLYSPARQAAFSPRNIRAAWASAGLYPFNPRKVLDQIPKPAAEPRATGSDNAALIRDSARRTISPRSPVTPLSTEAVASLQNLISQEIHSLDEARAERLQKQVQKLTNATQLSFAERALLQDNVRFLSEINSEAKVRRATKSKVIGTARVMSYEDLVSARADGTAKEAAKEAASDARKARKVEKASAAAARAEKVPTGEGRRGRKRQSVAAAAASQSLAEETSDNPEQIPDSSSIPWQAPVARMW